MLLSGTLALMCHAYFIKGQYNKVCMNKTKQTMTVDGDTEGSIKYNGLFIPWLFAFVKSRTLPPTKDVVLFLIWLPNALMPLFLVGILQES